MKNSRIRRVIFCLSFLAILISTVAILSCHAENHPDISKVDPSLYLRGKQEFFRRPNSGYALISTDLDHKTTVSLLNNNLVPDYDCKKKLMCIKFAYEKATLYGRFLFLVGNSPAPNSYIKVERIDLISGKYLTNKIVNVDCDFSRDFIISANNKFSLVTVRIGNVIEPDTKASPYIFNIDKNTASIDLHPVGPNDSTSSSSAISSTTDSTADSLTDSSTDSSIDSNPADSTADSSTSSKKPEMSKPPIEMFYFDEPVTVESLQHELDKNAHGQKLRVFTVNNKEVKSGNVGTGQIIETDLNSNIESRYIAVIPGDLDGTGIVTENDCQILYSYFTKSPTSNSSFLKGPFFDAAKINNDNKIDTARYELYPSDLLKIKKLIK